MDRELRPAAHLEFDAFREAYLRQLTAPLDDMWMAFAEMAAPHGLFAEGECVGVCAVDGEQRLLRFCLRPELVPEATDWLRLAVERLDVRELIVPTYDPGFLAPALDLEGSVGVHSFLFTEFEPRDGARAEGLKVAAPGDFDRLVDFQERALGAPREFLESYVGARIERGELRWLEAAGEVLATGELRLDGSQGEVAHLGLIVAADARGRGVGTGLLRALADEAQQRGWRPVCSTERANGAARKAIERVGFRPSHRLLSVRVER
ncbi:MAG: GNAT family N-acetyltransferase [Planctomycetota bacterium]|jgi:GNAT superfamily N-acetyltransferase